MIDRQNNKKGGGGKRSGGRRSGGGGGGGGGRSMRRGWDWGGDDDDYFDPYRSSDFDVIGGASGLCRAVPEPCYPLKEPKQTLQSVTKSSMLEINKQQNQACKPSLQKSARSEAAVKPPGKQSEPAQTDKDQKKRTSGGLQVWGGRIEGLLQNRPHGLFKRMLEKMYEKANGELLPEGWLEEAEGVGKVVVERKANSSNPICSLPGTNEQVEVPVSNSNKQIELHCAEKDQLPGLGAWDTWDVEVSNIWHEHTTLGVNITRLRDRDQLVEMETEMQAYYSKESNRERPEEAKPGSYVAVLHLISWCRGQLMSVDGNLMINLVDKGIIVPLPALHQSKVLRLSPQFRTLPAAVVRGELSGVELKTVSEGQAAVDWLKTRLVGKEKVFQAEARWRLGRHLSLNLTDPSLPTLTANISKQLLTSGLVVPALT